MKQTTESESIRKFPEPGKYPLQAASGSLVIERSSDEKVFRIMLRETVTPDGFVRRQRVIVLNPKTVAQSSDNPLGFADLVEMLATRIREEYSVRTEGGEA